MALIQNLASVLGHMLAVAEGHFPHRSHFRVAVFSPSSQREQGKQIGNSPVPAREIRSIRPVGKIFLQCCRKTRDDFVCGQLRSQLNGIQKLSIYKIRKPAILSQRPAEMPQCDRKETLPGGILQRKLSVHGVQLVSCILLPKVRKNRPQILFLLIDSILQRQPEQTLIHLLVDLLMKGVVKGKKLFPVVMQVNGAYDAVPVDICLPVCIIDTKARFDRIVVCTVPDQIRSTLFLKFRNFHRASTVLMRRCSLFPDLPGSARQSYR